MKTLIIIYSLLISIYNLYSQDFSTISGTVSDEQSGEASIGLTVMLLRDTTQGSKPLAYTMTNKFGFYSIPKITPGRYFIRVRGVGYRLFQTQIVLEAGRDFTLNVKMKSVDVKLQEVTVEAERDLASPATISTVNIDPVLVMKMPSLGGEIDLFRVIQLLPGVEQASELSSGLYIRGGSPDQNLILLDGVIVYNPNHLGGFLSSFNTDAIKDIKLIKGAFPAEYGGRMSSVLDLTMREGTKEKISGSGGISIISSKLTIEGPITEDFTFMVSGRRMYLDLLTNLFYSSDDEVPQYYFYDLNAKVNYRLGDNDRIFASGFFSRDVLAAPPDQEDVFDIHWGNATGNLRWMHIFSPSLFTNYSLIYTNYKFNSQFTSSDSSSTDFGTSSGIEDLMMRAEAQWFPQQEHTIKAGLEATLHRFESRATEWLIEDINRELGIDFASKQIVNTLDASLYLQDEWKISDDWQANFGGRFYYFQEGDYLSFEPRVSASYLLGSEMYLKASVALAHQYLHLISRNDLALPTDLWFPSTSKIKPGSCWQGVLAYETSLFDKEYFFSAEIYYKDMKNLYEYKDDAEFSFGIPLETQFTSGKGWAYGLELFINKRIGSFTGWFGYTLAWTMRQFPELNDGKPFPPKYDRRHDFEIVLTYELGDSWEFAATWMYGTGQAITLPTAIYSFPPIGADWSWYWGNNRFLYSDRNAQRMPAFHKLDVNFMHKFEWFGLPFQLSLNVYNLYNRRNPFAIYLDRDYDYNTGNSKYVLKKVTLFPVIPSLGLSFKF